MKINFFELFEDLFEGTLYFLYNILASAATLLRHPLAGPGRLAAARASAKAAGGGKEQGGGPKPRPQVGGLTFLFVCLFTALLALELLPGGGLQLRALLSVVGEPGKIGVGPAWPAVIGALIAAAIVDAAARLIVLLGQLIAREGDIDSRDERVNCFEYALFWPLFLLMATVALVMLVQRGTPPAEQDGPLFYAGVTAAYLSYLVPMFQLWPSLRRPAAGREWRWLVTLPVAMLAPLILLTGAILLGQFAARALHGSEASPAQPAAVQGGR